MLILTLDLSTKRKSVLPPQKRRTTLTSPAASLTEAEQIARARNLNLSAVIAEALNTGLRVQTAAEPADEALDNYRRAFFPASILTRYDAGFSPAPSGLGFGALRKPSPKRTGRRARRRTNQKLEPNSRPVAKTHNSQSVHVPPKDESVPPSTPSATDSPAKSSCTPR
jgi:hypothetical protein